MKGGPAGSWRLNWSRPAPACAAWRRRPVWLERWARICPGKLVGPALTRQGRAQQARHAIWADQLREAAYPYGRVQQARELFIRRKALVPGEIGRAAVRGATAKLIAGISWSIRHAAPTSVDDELIFAFYDHASFRPISRRPPRWKSGCIPAWTRPRPPS